MTSGAKFLLDTNYILGLLKSSPDVLEVKLPDAIIAATALVNGLQLLTLDKKLLKVTTEEGLPGA